MSRARIASVAAVIIVGLTAGGVHADPASTAFTYQAQFKKDGALFTGTIDFSGRLFDALTDGTLVAGPVNLTGVSVVDGVFTVPLDFGTDPFDGDARFLEIAVREVGEPAFTTLAPRQELTPAPYAIRALIDETFGLPFEATIDVSQPAFQIRNDGGSALVGIAGEPAAGFPGSAIVGQAVGAASAAFFENTSGPGVSSLVPVVGIESNVNATALSVEQESDADAGFFETLGKGRALHVQNRYPNQNGNNAAVFETSGSTGDATQNIADTLRVLNRGKGSAGSFETAGSGEINNAAALLALTDSVGPALEARTTGGGGAGKFEIQSPGSTGLGVEIRTDADGIALRSSTSGTGAAGAFIITDPPAGSSSSTSAAVAATTSGLGPASFFEITRLDNTEAAVEATTSGLGPAGDFQTANQANTSAALKGTHLSMESGPAAHLMAGGTDPAALPIKAALRAVQLRGGTGGGSAAEFVTLGLDNDDPTVFAGALGRGGAGHFAIINSETDETGRNAADALKATTIGFGRAGLFEIASGPPVDNDQPAIEARTAGTGPAGRFLISNPDSPESAGAVEGRTVGLGSAARFEIDRPFSGTGTDPVNNSPALHVTTNASGQVARLESTSIESVNPALEATVAGRGIVGRFAANAADNPNTALVTETSGLGSAGSFEIFNANNTSPALFVATNGTGPAATFEGVNAPNASVDTVQIRADNARHALFAQQTGVGEAAHFEIADPGNANLGVFIKNNGTGQALQVMNTNPFFGALALAVIGKSAFNGQVDVIGNLVVDGNATVINGQLCADSVCAAVKNFKIDHPVDPQNKYLQHSSIESNEMANIYSGTVVLDESGEAVVTLPEWFEALNRDFRYQLTCIGGFAPVYIAEEIVDNRFRIAGGRAGMKVSWQVTGIRQDTYAREHPLQVEVEKRQVARAAPGED